MGVGVTVRDVGAEEREGALREGNGERGSVWGWGRGCGAGEGAVGLGVTGGRGREEGALSSGRLMEGKALFVRLWGWQSRGGSPEARDLLARGHWR